jgi:uncharacterized protein YceK
MVRKLCLGFIVICVGGVLLAGCGSSSKSSSDTSGSASSPPATTGSTSTPSTNGALANNPQVKAAVAACKQSINAQPTLSADLKSKLSKVCDKAGTGDEAGAKKATQQVCEAIVNSGKIPSGPAKDQALAACKK